MRSAASEDFSVAGASSPAVSDRILKWLPQEAAQTWIAIKGQSSRSGIRFGTAVLLQSAKSTRRQMPRQGISIVFSYDFLQIKMTQSESDFHSVQLCVLASGLLSSVIEKCRRSMSSSCLHFGQKSRKFCKIVSSRIHTRVFPWQLGHSSHVPSLFIQSTCPSVGAEINVICRVLLFSFTGVSMYFTAT